MLLALDIGNSTISAGLFRNSDLLAHISFPSDANRSSDELFDLLDSFVSTSGTRPHDIAALGISSVVPPLTKAYSEYARVRLGKPPLIVDPSVYRGRKIHYTDPKQLGPDRLCSAVAGFEKFGGPLIVIDFGTATTYGVVSETGDFLGGAITLGIQSTIESLRQRTALLPAISPALPSKAIATDTVSALQVGVMFSLADAVEGMVRRMRAELGKDARVVATGGMSALLASFIPVIETVEPNLVLEGVRIITEQTVQVE